MDDQLILFVAKSSSLFFFRVLAISASLVIDSLYYGKVCALSGMLCSNSSICYPSSLLAASLAVYFPLDFYVKWLVGENAHITAGFSVPTAVCCWIMGVI